VFNREFNSGQVTCYPAWDAWTGYKQYNLTDINSRINYLEDRGKTQMMHLLLGPDMYFPDWFKNGSYTNAQLEDMLQDWIRSMIQSNSNNTKVEVWNVVNEALGWSETGQYPPDSDIKWQQLGWEADQSGLTGADKVHDYHPVYIRKAFEYARQYTNAKLELRDSGAEFPDGPNSYKYRSFYQLAKHLLNKGVPLDAVGFQVHIDIQNTYNWEGFKNNINRYRALGLETYITELDIGDTQQSWNDVKAQQQRAMYYQVCQIARETDMEYVHFWGLIDGKDPGWRTNESPLLFDPSYNPKPAYYGVQQALQDGGQGNLITVRALGMVGDELMQLEIDGVPVKTWTLFTSMQKFTCGTTSSSGNLRVAFLNDQGNRDVQVDYVTAYGTTYQAENQQVNTGVYQGQCGGSYSEWLHCSGFIDFGTISFGAIQTPYGGTPRSIPGLIQGEDYDSGGEGLAYHDADTANNGGQYRNDGVDIETTTDSGGGYNVGWIENGEWLEYAVNVASTSSYDFSFRTAALSTAGTCHVEIDGVDVTGAFTIPVTGAWQTYTSVVKTSASITAGQHIMRVAMDVGAFNLNWLNIVRHNNPPSVSITSPANGATFTAGANIAINANASDSDGSVTKIEFFSGGNKIGEDTSSPYSMTWSNVTAGSYALTARATDNEGGTTTSAGVNITVNPPPGGTNLLVNGGFESGTSSWSGQGCSISSSSTAHSGSKSVVTSSRTASWAGPVQNITAAVAANGQGNYNLSAWYKMASGSATARVTVKLVSTSGGTTYPGVQGSVTTSWTQVSGQVSLTWNGTLTLAELFLETPSGTTNFYADDCSISAVVPNLLTNAGFENGITGWSGQNCTITASTTVHSGSGSVRAASRTGSYAGPIQNITGAVAANGQGNYTVSAWMKMNSGSTSGSVTIRLVSGAGTTYTVTSSPVTTSWSQVSGTAYLTWSGTLTLAELYLETTSGTTTFFADDISIKRSLSKPDIEESEPLAVTPPLQHTLMQNYPNPFNPHTTIAYKLGEREHVQIEIFNLKGQFVDVLVDAVQEPGSHQVVFEARALDSGMYICKMTAGGFMGTRKIIFVK